MSINTSLFPGNAWTYVNLASPIVLAAGQTYYIYRFTSSTTPDEFYQASSVTTTTDATLVGSLYSYDEQNWTVATDGKEFSLCDFQYSITTTLATIPGSPFVPLGRQLLPMFVGAPLSIVSGTITLDVSRIDAFGFGGVPTPVNTVVVQYWLDGQPFGPQILGPLEDTGNQNLPHWPLALDTTKLTDGTHVVFPQVVDTRSGGYASAAFYMAYSQQLIVANNGLNNGAQTIPLSPNAGESYIWPPLPDTVYYDGNPQRTINTFSHPFPSVPPATNPSSAFYNNVAAARNPGSYYVVDLFKNKNHEFENDVQFCTTPQGGVGISGFGNEAGNSFSSGMVSELQAIVPWARGRYDSRTTAYVTWIAEASDNGFVGCDHTGSVTWVDIQGNSTTLVGITLNRAATLPYQKELVNSLATDAERLAVYTKIGTAGAHDITNWGGLNGICYDPRNTQRLYLTNILWNYILKVDLSTNPATYTRFAGVEQNTGGYSGDGGDPLMALFNGPYSCIMTSDGVLLIADKFNGAIRQITTDSNGNAIALSTLCGGTRAPANAPNENRATTADASPAASFTGSISGTTLTVSSVSSGYIAPGQLLQSAASGFVAETYVTALGTGLGHTGTYIVSASQTVASGSAFTGVAVPWNPTAASFVGGISGTTLTVTSINQGNPGMWQPLSSTASGFVAGTFIISQPPPNSGGVGQYTVNISQTVAPGSTFTAHSVPSNPTGVVPLSSAYINFPNTIKFAANSDGSITTASTNAKIVLYEADSNTIRLIDLSTQTIKPLCQFEQYLRGGLFSWFDIDINGACMAQNDMVFAHHNLDYTVVSLDGTYIGPNWNGNPAPFGTPYVQWLSGLTEGPNADSSLLLDPSQAAYPWNICFCKTRAAFLIGGFREFASMLWRAPLPSDLNPEMPESSKNLYATGALMWNVGTCLFFPRGVRPSLATLHGGLGFGHLGSDVGKTVHDMCVVYNNGSAAYNAAGDNEALLNSVFIDPTGMAGADRTSSTPGANALGMGNTKRPELNVGSYDWQALSFFLRRTTTAGTYPVVALPGPTPAATAMPIISNVVLTRKSFTEIDVTWDTNKSTIGLACAGSDSNFNNTFRVQYINSEPLPYSAWSMIEPVFATTGHSAAITWCPMSIPTHVSIICKDTTGNFAYAQDQTIGIHPDGTTIIGGTGSQITPNNTTKLVNNFGEWSFGEGYAPQPGGGAGTFYYVTLNGRKVDPAGGTPNAQQLRIDEGGNIWMQTYDMLWFYWANGFWWAVNNNTIGTPDPLFPAFTPAINPPFAVSPDGTTITNTTGSLSNEFGIWTIDSGGFVNLNGFPLRNGVEGFSPWKVAVSQLQINAHGQLFMQLTDSTWRVWVGNAPNASTGPGSGPIPVDIVVNRSAFSIAHSSAAGTTMATLAVTMSDGSVFSGSYSIGIDSNGHQSAQMSGNNVQYGPFTYSGANVILCTITATQNGSSFAILFDEQIS